MMHCIYYICIENSVHPSLTFQQNHKEIWSLILNYGYMDKRKNICSSAIYVNDISLKLKWKNNKRYKLNIEIIKCKKETFTCAKESVLNINDTCIFP